MSSFSYKLRIIKLRAWAENKCIAGHVNCWEWKSHMYCRLYSVLFTSLLVMAAHHGNIRINNAQMIDKFLKPRRHGVWTQTCHFFIASIANIFQPNMAWFACAVEDLIPFWVHCMRIIRKIHNLQNFAKHAITVMGHRSRNFLISARNERIFLHVFSVFSATVQNIGLKFWHMQDDIIWKVLAGPKFEKSHF